MPKTREDFDLESGGFDDFDGEIAKVYFANPPDTYAAGLSGDIEPGMHVVINNPELEKPLDQFYSCGGKKGWKASEDGSEVTSEVKPELHAFNASSNAGRLAQRMMILVGGGDPTAKDNSAAFEKGKEFFMARDAYMTQEPFYLGLKFHWKREKFATQSGETSPLLPNRYLGDATSGSATAAKPAAKKAGSAPAATPSGDSAALDKIVVDLAEGKTARELKQAALKNDKLKANSAYMKEVISGAVLKRLEDAGDIALVDDKYVKV